jgi:hypothetical protein
MGWSAQLFPTDLFPRKKNDQKQHNKHGYHDETIIICGTLNVDITMHHLEGRIKKYTTQYGYS